MNTLYLEIITQLFRMHPQRCEHQKIYEETSLLLRPNFFFFLTRFFGDKYRLMYKKSSSFVYMFLQLSVFPSGYPYKGENWHALSDEQYFSKHRFLEICHCVLKYLRPKLSRIERNNISKFWAVADLLRKHATGFP